MAKHFTEEKLLHSAQSLFETLESRTETAQELAEYTYDTDKVAERKALCDEVAKNRLQPKHSKTLYNGI